MESETFFNPAAVSSLLRGNEETEGTRDKIGNFEPQFASRRWAGPLYRPVADEWLAHHAPQFREAIRWPNNAPFAAALTHDVDGIRDRCRVQLWRKILLKVRTEKQAVKKLAHLTSLTGLRHRPSSQDLISPWIQAEKERGFLSTFYLFSSHVPNRHSRDLTYHWKDRMPFRGKLRSVREVFREVSAEGWDVGLHGSILSASTPGLLAEQRSDLATALGKDVVSARQHNLQFEISCTPGLIAEAGFESDSTLGSNRDAIFRNGTSYPFPLWSIDRQKTLPTLELPLVLHDGALMRGDNLDMDSESATRAGKMFIDRIAEMRGVVTLLWHPENIVKPGYFEVYVRLLDYLRDRGAWGSSARDISRWWTSSGNAAAHAAAIASLRRGSESAESGKPRSET